MFLFCEKFLFNLSHNSVHTHLDIVSSHTIRRQIHSYPDPQIWMPSPHHYNIKSLSERSVSTSESLALFCAQLTRTQTCCGAIYIHSHAWHNLKVSTFLWLPTWKTLCKTKPLFTMELSKMGWWTVFATPNNVEQTSFFPSYISHTNYNTHGFLLFFC